MAARVLWLTKGLGLGGAERLLTLIAPRLDRRRFDVEVAYLLPFKDALVADLAAQHVPATCLQARRTLDPGWVGRLRQLLARRPFDIVHTHSPVPAAVARVLAPRQTKFVHTEHNVWDRYRWPTYAANVATYQRNAAVLAVSRGVAESVDPPWWSARRSMPPVEVLLHGVDLDASPRGPHPAAHARGLLDIPASAPVIGTVANFTPKKDHAGLIAAIDLLRGDIPDLVVLLIGTGPTEPQIRAEVHARGLASHVRFLGSRDDVATLLPAMDVFVLGSRYEGLPISLLEAMAAGVPCVATRVGGVPEAVDDGRHGLLVAPGDPSALAGAVRELLLDADARATMGSQALDHVRQGFSIERAAQRIEEVYDDTLGQRPTDPGRLGTTSRSRR